MDLETENSSGTRICSININVQNLHETIRKSTFNHFSLRLWWSGHHGCNTGMALAAQGQVFLCTSLGNNHHRLKARGGPKVKGLFLPPSSEDFLSCFSWPKDHTRRDADGGGGGRENSEVGTSWGEADVERKRWEKRH